MFLQVCVESYFFTLVISSTAIEVFVSEVVFDDETGSGEVRSTLIYGWNDSIRELALASAFIIDSVLVEKLESSTEKVAYILMMGVLPAICIALMITIHAIRPRITSEKPTHTRIIVQEEIKDEAEDAKKEPEQQEYIYEI